MQTLNLKLQNKCLQFPRGQPETIVVGDNTDYYIHFDIDDKRTAMFAVFVRKNDKNCCCTEDTQRESVLIDENGCANIPRWVLKQGSFNVGVISNGYASTPLTIYVEGSIIDKGGSTAVVPPQAELDRLLELINKLGSCDCTLTEEQVKAMIEAAIGNTQSVLEEISNVIGGDSS